MTTQAAIPKNMKAVVTHGYNDVRVEEVPTPELEAGFVLCKTGGCGICGTDAHIIQGAYKGTWPPWFPFIQGHEWAGTVMACGEGADSVKPGDRVLLDDHRSCLTCRMCRRGRYTLCESMGKLKPGGHRLYGHDEQGGFAEFLKAAHWQLHKIPDDMPFEEAIIANQATTALHAVERVQLQAGENVLVVGPGLLGLLTMQIAFAVGAFEVYVVGRGARLAFAKKLGASEIIDFTKENPVERVWQLTGDRGADIAFDCAGTIQAIQTCVMGVGRGGRVAITGFNGGIEVPIVTDRFSHDEVDLFGVRSHPNTWEATINLMAAGRLDVKPLVSGIYPMENFLEAMEAFVQRKDGAIRNVIKP
ncbi:MAG: zinc-binding dehydrogenase [Nitrospinota bacterium]